MPGSIAFEVAMKRTLILVRHAKSSLAGAGQSDMERPLADRGRHDAPIMGRRVAKQEGKPDLILSSPARRALTTAEIFAEELGYKAKDIVVDDRLYATHPATLLAVIGGLDEKLKCVMLFGHNPEFSELAHRLSSDIAELPTCAVVQFTFASKSWESIGSVKPEKVVLDYPKKA